MYCATSFWEREHSSKRVWMYSERLWCSPACLPAPFRVCPSGCAREGVPERVFMPFGVPTPFAVGFSGVVARRLIGGLVRQERPTLLHSGASASNVDVTFLGTKASCQLHEVVERMRVGERLDARRLPGGGAHQDSLDGHLEHLPGERARHLG